MKKIIYSLAFILVLISLMNIVNAKTISDSDFIVDNVKIEKISSTSQEAKDSAMLDGKRQALTVIFKRLGIKEENIKFVNNDMLTQMIDSIQISDETVTPTKYSGTLLITFNREFIDFYTKQLKINNGELLNTRYLYIPILKIDNNYLVLNKDNIWREKSVDVFLNKQYEDIILLNNNPANNTIIKKNAIEKGTYDDFYPLLTSHEANTILLSIAEYIKESDSLEITLKDINALETTELKLNLFNKENLEYNDLIADGADKVLVYINNSLEKTRSINSQNKQESTVVDQLNQMKEFEATIIFSNIDELNFFKDVLKNLSFIDRYEIKNLTTRELNVKIYLNVFVEEVYSLFREHNILMKTKNNRFYLIYLD